MRENLVREDIVRILNLREMLGMHLVKATL